ncbi:hypothetical protein [Paenirhodobacter populi]|uniref:Uncharacterized protein n=1 Tax=Paenirhodobacter populi TaxID=2306993 RepID=A0A443IPT9_9RHOB|nr:hypothetical protein [Sinirhodobacter populi]RWR08492.1 hypothetical protein D2T33_15465 [Sinirhodobacter populi]
MNIQNTGPTTLDREQLDELRDDLILAFDSLDVEFVARRNCDEARRYVQAALRRLGEGVQA